MTDNSEYNRLLLTVLCRNGFVPQEKWKNRDSASAQMQLGQCYALLKAGCDYRILDTAPLKTNNKTIWLEITFNGFNSFEFGSPESETFYIPTLERLEEVNGDDWY